MRRLKHVTMRAHETEVPTHITIPSWVKVLEIAVTHQGQLDYTDAVLITWIPKWWARGRLWK